MNTTKLDELMVYLCTRCASEKSWGRTKLAKLLYFCDFEMYRHHGQSITGIDYIRLDLGPVPVDFQNHLARWKDMGIMAEAREQIIDHTEIRPVALRESDVSVFSGPEVKVIEQVIRKYGHLTAKKLSEISHQDPGWRLAKPLEKIPYDSVFSNWESVTPEEYGLHVAIRDRNAS